MKFSHLMDIGGRRGDGNATCEGPVALIVLSIATSLSNAIKILGKDRIFGLIYFLPCDVQLKVKLQLI